MRGLCPKCLALVALGGDPEATLRTPPPPAPDDVTLRQSSAGDEATLSTPSRSPSAPAGAPPSATVRYFGDYEMLSEIARGGMGVVFKARQKSLNRIVALKMILGGHFVSREEVERFHAEAEAVASLDHPNIVPIYEVGEDDGRHYFSMKLVEGGSLASRMGEFQLPAPDAKPPLSRGALAARLRAIALLMATVARAVHYAHQRRILHRDLKPGNILLDAKGEPHVTDFGLAKREGTDSQLTVSGAVLGTPSYMAPEQAAGKARALSTAADLYSLGAILYHLLAGRPPFVADTPLEVMRQAVEKEPERPSTLNARADRDLETICLKCLEKDPKRRYSSGEALAEDLERWLKGEPILARPSTRGERVVKWARRKPALAALSATTVAVAVTGLIAVLWQWNEAVQARKIADENASRANANLDKARQAVQFFLRRVADDPKLKSADLYALRTELLESAVPFCEDFVRQRRDDPALERARGEVYGMLGNLRSALGDTRQAMAGWEMARDVFAGLAKAFPTVATNHQALAASYEHLGRLLLGEGRVREAGHSYLAALQIREQLVREAPASADRWNDAAACRHYLGIAWQKGGETPKAEAAYRQALELLAPFEFRFPNHAGHRHLLGSVHLSLGSLLMNELGRTEQAEESFRVAASVFARVVTEEPRLHSHRFDQAAALGNLGLVLRNARRLPEAGEATEQAVELLERLADDFSGLREYRHHLGNCLRTLATIYSDTRTKAEAEAAAKKAQQLHAKLAIEFPGVPDFRSALGEDHHCLATLGLEQRAHRSARIQLADAIRHQQAALAINAQNPAYRRLLQSHLAAMSGLAEELLRLNEHEPAAETALEIRSLLSADWQASHRAAAVVARCVPLARQDSRLAPEARASKAESYAARAVELLHEVLRLGFKQPEQWERDAAFEPLRERDDFKRLIRGATAPRSGVLQPDPRETRRPSSRLSAHFLPATNSNQSPP